MFSDVPLHIESSALMTITAARTEAARGVTARRMVETQEISM